MQWYCIYSDLCSCFYDLGQYVSDAWSICWPGIVNQALLWETYSVFQLYGFFGFTVWRHRILLFKVWSNYTLLHHLRTKNKTKTSNTAKHQTMKTSLLRDKRPKSKRIGENNPMNNTIAGVIGFTCLCITIKFIIHSASRRTFKWGKINHLFTSSWIFFSFSFCSELETGFDLLPSKLMYKPPSSFTLMPGSIRLDISFLKQIGTEKIPQEERSCLISHLRTRF